MKPARVIQTKSLIQTNISLKPQSHKKENPILYYSYCQDDYPATPQGMQQTSLQGVTRKKRTATDLLVLTRLFGT